MTGHMRRFLSVVEHELDCEDFEGLATVTADEEETTQDDDDKSPKPSSTAIVAVEEMTMTHRVDDAEDEDKDAEASGDDDEAGSRLVVIDKTRLVPQLDVDTFVGY